MLNKKTISAHIESQLPEFVRQDHGTFVDFVEAYYQWLETSNNPYLMPYQTMTYKDVDRTVSVFLDQIQNEVMQLWPKRLDRDVDRKNLIKNIKDFYESKGTEKSIRFIFRVLFQEEIDIKYPRDEMLQASDGKWVERKSIKITNDNNKFESLSGLTISQQKPLNEITSLEVRPLNRSEQAFAEVGFTSVIDVFGIKVFHNHKESSNAPEFYHVRVASILAQLLDNDGDGIVDNKKMHQKLLDNNVVIYLTHFKQVTKEYVVGRTPDNVEYYWIDIPSETSDGAIFADAIEVDNVIDLTSGFTFTREGPAWEYLVGRMLEILIVAGYSRLENGFVLGDRNYDTDISLGTAYGEATNYEDYTNVDPTADVTESSVHQYEGIKFRQYRIDSYDDAIWPPESKDSLVDDQLYYLTTALMMNMGFYTIVAETSEDEFVIRQVDNTDLGTDIEAARSFIGPWTNTPIESQPIISARGWKSSKNYNKTKYSSASFSLTKGGNKLATTTVLQWYTQSTATAALSTDDATEKTWGNYWLLDESWGDTRKRTDLIATNPALYDLIEKYNLPTKFPTSWYRPTGTGETGPQAVSTARVIQTQQYKVPPDNGYELYLDDIVGSFDGRYPIKFTIDDVEYEENLYRLFSGVGWYNNGLRYSVEDVVKITPTEITIDSQYRDPVTGVFPVDDSTVQGDKINITADGVGGLAVIDKVGDVGQIERIRISNFGLNYNNWLHDITIATEFGVFARGSILADWVAEYQGYWLDDDGKLSSIKRLRDNERYHEYSYVIESKLSLAEFKDSLYRLAHPGGTAVFGDIVHRGGDEFTYKSRANILMKETPLIGSYLPYTFNTETNLRQFPANGFVLPGREDELPTEDTGRDTDELIHAQVDLYPDGFNPDVGPVAEDSSVPHNPLDTDDTDSSAGPINTNVQDIFFSDVPPVSDASNINTYWVVYPHPYSRLQDVLDPKIGNIRVLDFILTTISDTYYNDKSKVRNLNLDGKPIDTDGE